MHLNNLSSALSHRSSKLVKSLGQKPALMLRLMNACNLPLTSALAKPHQACEAYVSLAMTDARKIVCWFFSFIPLARRIRRAYSDCPDDAITSDTWSAMEKLLVSVTPRIFRVETLVSPGNSGTSCVPRLRGFRKIISYDFLQLRLRLLFAAQDCTCWISTSRLAMFRAGMTRSVSSANLIISFPSVTGWRKPVPVRIPGWSWLWCIRSRILLRRARFCVNGPWGVKWPSYRHCQACPEMRVSPQK